MASHRYSSIDTLRGLAVALMVIYHFFYDLVYFGFYDFDFHADPFWIVSRSFIVSLFVVLVGVSLYLAHHRHIRWLAAFKRIAILILSAGLITAISYVIFPDRPIVFGIIHFIAAASLIALPFVRFPVVSLFIGLVIIITGNLYSNEFFNQSWIHWLGMMTHRPATEDYAPLFPWLGVVLIGISLGYWLTRTTMGEKGLLLDNKFTTNPLLTWSGRHSLAIYLLHQPLLFAVFSAYNFGFGR
jgi:uncharacterized membrane protein